MADRETKLIAGRYLSALQLRGIPITAAYLFGSRVKGNARKDSDIDIALVSPGYSSFDDEKSAALWLVRDPSLLDIEPHAFSPEDFENGNDPMVHEIKTTGERIA